MTDLAPVNPQTFDPYLRVRDKTAHRNEVQEVAHRYSQMERLALAQLNALRERRTKAATLGELQRTYAFAQAEAQRLWAIVVKLDTEITEEMERMQNE